MTLSCGVDLVEIDRVAAVIGRWGDRFLIRVFTDAERAYCRGRVPELAVRFAAKEAVSKALGTGIVGISWRDIEVVPDPRGKPLVVLHNRAKARATATGLTAFEISLSHSRNMAIAIVVAQGVGREGS
ncbi:MAG: holo-[acyl-carrier-protein] synthase [Chloroflexi bacterium]|nr:holo-[acyl-carrier-protein] synthase [Chloroflexota bacterium]